MESSVWSVWSVLSMEADISQWAYVPGLKTVRLRAEKCEQPGLVAKLAEPLRDRLMVGRRTLDAEVGVRVPVPQYAVPSGPEATMVHVLSPFSAPFGGYPRRSRGTAG